VNDIDSIEYDMLTRAAYAVGLEYSTTRENYDPNEGIYIKVSRDLWVDWHPIRSDADAFRLAVHLGMDLFLGDDNMAKVYIPGAVQGYACDFESDPREATRWAIVEATANYHRDKEHAFREEYQINYDDNPEFRHWRPYKSRFQIE